MICPDCGRSVTVPPRRRKRPKPDPTQEIDGQYDTQAGTADDGKPPLPIGRQYGSPAGSARCWTKMADCPRSRRRRAGRWFRAFSPSPGVTAPGQNGSRCRVGAMLIAGMGLFGWSLGQDMGWAGSVPWRPRSSA